MRKNIPTREISISYNNMFILNTLNTKFLGLVTANSPKDHITQLIPKIK